jgi:DNA-binding NarL/FixJ family response regulator
MVDGARERRSPVREKDIASDGASGSDESAGRLRVLVVDDHDLYRLSLCELLEEDGFEVADSPDAKAAIRQAASFSPHVVVMDMKLPGMSGIEATPLVLQAAPGTRVLMLTLVLDGTDDARERDAVRAGAHGLLAKDAQLGAIAAEIRAAAASARDDRRR